MNHQFDTLIVIMGNQLFPSLDTLKPDFSTLVFMAEDLQLCKRYRYHRMKLVLVLSAMRSYRDRMQQYYPVEYWSIDGKGQHKSFVEKLSTTLHSHHIKHIKCFEIPDRDARHLVENFCSSHHIKLSVYPSPGFLTPLSEFKAERMQHFYIRQRKRLNLLMVDNKPAGGSWSYDKENRKPLPRKIYIPEPNFPKQTDHTENIKSIIDKLFPDHPGDSSDFCFPTTRDQALHFFDDFLKHRFIKFGPYEDAISKTSPFIFHSVISPALNIGLITPEDIISKLCAYIDDENIPLSTLEGFIRQIIGWREYIYGMYRILNFNKNFFNHQRKLTKFWYNGTTGIPPLDTCIRRVHQYGYLHHIERLMIVGNLMLLCNIHPDDVYTWFMELFIDSSDWVMTPNVYGMSQFADGGQIATKPYIAGSNYILRMSNYAKGDWCSTVDGLYWRFINQHKAFFSSNPRMGIMIRSLEKLDKNRKQNIFAAAESFIERTTISA